MNYDKIGKFIQEKRKEKNLTQKELANKLGVTDRAVSKWERGVGCPDVSILEILLSIIFLAESILFVSFNSTKLSLINFDDIYLYVIPNLAVNSAI